MQHHLPVSVSFGSFIGFHKTSVNIREYSNKIMLYRPLLLEISLGFKLRTYQNNPTTLKHFIQPKRVNPTHHTKFSLPLDHQTLKSPHTKKKKGVKNLFCLLQDTPYQLSILIPLKLLVHSIDIVLISKFDSYRTLGTPPSPSKPIK